MKKKMRRLVSFILALFLVLSLLPTSALAEETADQTTTEKGTAYFAPDTEQVLGEGRIEGSVTRKPVYAEKDNGYYTDVEEAIALLRERMVDRRSVIEIPLRVSKTEVSASDLQALIEGMFALALGHTGVEDQGDYLLWSFAEMGYNATYTETDSYYYLDIPYEFTYYTTLEQEVSVGRKLDSIFASFGFTEQTDDYTKIKTIYDYICANVTYDYANLENDAYTLKYTAYAALNNGTAVCQGYATLLYRMLLRAGVDCRVITGVDHTNEAHAWNIVALDGAYYNMDSTWDAAGNNEYQYFLKGATDFPDHFRDAAYDIEEFHTVYPMAVANYVPGETPILANGTCGDGLTWTLTTDGVLTISGSGAMDDYWFGDIPWGAYEEYIRSVVIEEGVTHVGNHAFFTHESLLTVYIPSSVKSIGSYAFANCYFIEEIHITDLAAWCAITFDDNPLYYGKYLYLNGEKVTDLTIPNTVAAISPYAFRGGVFQTVTIPSSIRTIDRCAFYEAKITNLSLPEGLESIGESAFYSSSVSMVALPSTLQAIGPYAFSGSAVTSIVLPDTLTDLGTYAFANCMSLQSVIIGNGLQGIPDHTFSGCSALENITFGQNVRNIGRFAFHMARSLTSIQIPASVEVIERGAFYDCVNLRQVIFAEGLQTVGLDAFYNCKLENLIFPSTLTLLDQSALCKCAALKSVTFIGNAPVFAWDCFRDTTTTVYYPAGNPTWTEEVRQQYGGEITWVAACTAHSFENGVCTICGEKDPDFKPGGLLGDADGSGVVDYVDAMLVLQYHTGVITNEALTLAQCDVDASGAVDYVDAMRILQYHTGVISGF